jgi:hypothetical protein
LGNFRSDPSIVKALGDIQNAGHFFDKFMERLALGTRDYLHHATIPLNFNSLIKHNLVEKRGEVGNILYFLTDNGRRLKNELLHYGDKDRRYRELWHISASEAPSSES